MLELCDACGAPRKADGECRCGVGEAPKPLGLELDLDRGRPTVQPSTAPRSAAPAARTAPPAPIVSVVPHASRAPLPPPTPSGGLVPSGIVKVSIAASLFAVGVLGVMAGVRELRRRTETVLEDSTTRPYAGPNRLVVAQVTRDYSSEVAEDGALLLRHDGKPGSAAILTGWSGRGPAKEGMIAGLVAELPDKPTYRALETPADPCRSDADASETSLGELVFGDGRNVTLWTCSAKKRGNAYFLAWAARTADVETDRTRLMVMMKQSQLVANAVCAGNVGVCSADPASMIAAIVGNARR